MGQYLCPMMPPPFQDLKSQTRLVTPRRIGTTALRIAIAGVIAYILSSQSPWVMTLWYLYAGFNVLVLVGFWAFSRFLRKKLGALGQQFGQVQQDEDLGEAEVIEDAQIED
jgi:hypothetical protein